MEKKTKRIVYSALIAAIYAATTLLLAPLSFGPIQARFSEVLVLFAYFDPFYIVGLTLGCFIANILGSSLMDAVIGSFATLISVIMIYQTSKLKISSEKIKLFIASLWPVIFNGLIIGWMLVEFVIPKSEGVTILVAGLQVAAGEFLVVSIIGVIVIYKLKDRIKKLLN
ncbi:MAG: QueT transporter family protein [Clostridium sp.]|uniref:QueT transporter family protein n=1 Tax=Clostridium sp. TaxID=1506 RepID=UPI003F341705